MRLPALLLPALLLPALLLPAACSKEGYAIRDFRDKNVPCQERNLRMPCKFGPDGLLYRTP